MEWIIEHEHGRRLDDLILRRTDLALLGEREEESDLTNDDAETADEIFLGPVVASALGWEPLTGLVVALILASLLASIATSAGGGWPRWKTSSISRSAAFQR